MTANGWTQIAIYAAILCNSVLVGPQIRF